VEPAFFALADAQHALMDGASRVVTYGPDHNPHSPVTLANPITNLNYLSPISKRGKQIRDGKLLLDENVVHQGFVRERNRLQQLG
jgi:hypothetical protein